jgi:uncharacterized lipoprotein YajG
MNKSALVALAATFMLTACAQQTFVLNGHGAKNTNGNPVFSEDVLAPTQGAELKEHEHFFIGGLGQAQSVNAAKVCGSAANVAKVEVKQNILQGLLSVITFGIYSPREASVFCR